MHLTYQYHCRPYSRIYHLRFLYEYSCFKKFNLNVHIILFWNLAFDFDKLKWLGLNDKLPKIYKKVRLTGHRSHYENKDKPPEQQACLTFLHAPVMSTLPLPYLTIKRRE